MKILGENQRLAAWRKRKSKKENWNNLAYQAAAICRRLGRREGVAYVGSPRRSEGVSEEGETSAAKNGATSKKR
jgi:hypothetical protein